MPSGSDSRLCDALTAAALFLATAAFTLWQNSRVAVLWDLGYLLDSAWRFSLGQLPYRDLPFAHAPGTFLLHAAIIRIFGRVYYPHIAFAAAEAGAATLLTWRILLRLLAPLAERAWWTATLLASTLVPLGIYSVYPHPIYDSDCVLAVLAALYLLQRSMDGSRRAAGDDAGIETGRNALGALAGAACVLPLFFKQNIGLPFLAAALLAVAAAAFARRMQRATLPPPLSLFAGAFIALATAAGILQTTVGLLNYRYWTITFATQRRLPGLGDVLSIYHQTSLLWTIPAAAAGVFLLRGAATHHKRWARLSGFALLALPFLWIMAALTLLNDADDRADQLLSLWPHLLLLAATVTIANLRTPCLEGGARVQRAASPPPPARHRPRRVSVAAALGIDLRHLASAAVAHRADAGGGPKHRPAARRSYYRVFSSLRRLLRGQPRAPRLHPSRWRGEPRHAACAPRPRNSRPMDSRV